MPRNKEFNETTQDYAIADAKIKRVEVPERFQNVLFDWDYSKYVVVGGYGSGKSHNAAALKIILRLYQTPRLKCLVVRQVQRTIRESCFDLLKDIMNELGILRTRGNAGSRHLDKHFVRYNESQMEFVFPNGSRIISTGLDDIEKLKSIHGVTDVWVEEANEISYAGYKELLGRLRPSHVKGHIILTFNPVGKESWVYTHFFKYTDPNTFTETTIVDEQLLYEKGDIIKGDTYYHHSTVDDNPFVPAEYVDNLESIKKYDRELYDVARKGRFGTSTFRVFPQLEVARNAKEFKESVTSIEERFHFIGFDFGFESSFNAVVSCAVDMDNRILYIYDEIYANHVDDAQFARFDKMKKIKAEQLKKKQKGIRFNPIVADSEDTKAIQYYRNEGFRIRACFNRFNKSRISNMRKLKRFAKIVISPRCRNAIREWKNLQYQKDKNGDMIYDKFNIDPHTVSAVWYALDTIVLADPKEFGKNTVKGSVDTSYSMYEGRRGEKLNEFGDLYFEDMADSDLEEGF